MTTGPPTRYAPSPNTKYPVMINIIDDFTGHMILIWLIVMTIGLIELFAQEIGVPRAFVQAAMLCKLVAVIIIGTHSVFLACCTMWVLYDSM